MVAAADTFRLAEGNPQGAHHPRALLVPPMLQVGARVALISPSGPLQGPHELERAVATAESIGWEVHVGQSALRRTGYFAGSDAQRGDDVLAALHDDSIDGIWCLRGGYGAMRLLPWLSVELLRRHPKALIGFSDVTALHAAWQRAGLVSYHGPTARASLSDFSRNSLVRAVLHGTDSCGEAPEARVVRSGCVTGRLVGGNLALVSSLCGTPWAVDGRDAIVVLEDIGEATYRIDRMLTHLRLAGTFDGCVGVAFGHCTDCPDSSDDGTRSIEVIVTELANTLQVPTLQGIPVGHISDQWTVPFGAIATLDVDARTLSVSTAAVS